MAHLPEYQWAKLAWDRIRRNLEDRSIYDGANLDRELRREIDEEQIEVIRVHMGNVK